MALNRRANLLYVNLRDKQQIAVVDLKENKVAQTWSIPGLNLNTPMAFDPAHNRLFVAGRKPGKLFIVDSDSGRLVQSLDCVNTADDMTFDPQRARIYVSGAEGLSIFHQDTPDRYSLITQFPTQQGKTSIYVPSVHQFYIVHTKTDAGPAGLQVYRVND